MIAKIYKLLNLIYLWCSPHINKVFFPEKIAKILKNVNRIKKFRGLEV